MKINLLRPAIIKSLIQKEFKQTLRDKRMRFLLFGAPILMLVIFGYAVNTDITDVKMVILDRDKTKESRELISKFTASGYFSFYASVESPDKGIAFLDKGEADMYLHIPIDFRKNLLSGKSTNLQIILDGTDSNRASVIMAYINQMSFDISADYMFKKLRTTLLSRERGGIKLKEQLTLKERILFNPEAVSRNFFLPGMLGLIIAIITMVLTSMSVVKERESGTMDQIIVSPLRSIEFAAGKIIPLAIIGLIEITFISSIAILWFKVPFNGSFLFLLFSSIFYIMCTLAAGLYISTISETQQQAMLSTFLFLMPAYMLSGFIFPIYSMPEIFQYITLLNPIRYFVTIVRGIFLKGVGFSVLWQELLALTILGSGLVFLSVRRFNRRFE
ncbi:MAG: ABC transporter permease [Spirochaetes bacterium]|nr:ABC transporter permease [Spirochaetota bacterium]